MPDRAYIVFKVSKPAPGPEVITSFGAQQSEHIIYAVHKCKEMLAFKQYI